MRLRLVVSAAFLGVLGSFLLWSVQWSLDDRRDVIFEMPGKVTTLKLYQIQQKTDAFEVRAAGQELRRYLTEHALSLIVASPGDGSPQLTVFDPTRRLSWFNPSTSTSGAMSGVSLFEGSYSARRWNASSATPLLREGTFVEGIVRAPAGVGDLQYAEALGEIFPPGDYVLSGTTSVDVVRLQELLRRQGLEIQEVRRIPLVAYLFHSPLVVATAMFLVLGHVCAAAYWVLLLDTRQRELVIRRRHGARLSTLVRRWFASGLPPIMLGLLVGIIVSGVVVRVAGRQSLIQEQYLTLAMAAGLGLAFTSAVWLMAVAVGLIARDEVRGAA